MRKVDAVVEVLKAKKSKSATWSEIYATVAKAHPEFKKSKFWQEGIRGVVYREIRAGATFKMATTGVVALRQV